MISAKYIQLLDDLTHYVEGNEDFEQKYLILLYGLLQLRFSVSERFYQGLMVLQYNPVKVLELITEDIKQINQCVSTSNPYFTFYIQVLNYVNEYCLERIEAVQLPLDVRSDSVG